MSDKLTPALDWFERQGWGAFEFQIEAWTSIITGRSGLVNAPTGSGKTYALLIGYILKSIAEQKTNESELKLIWVTPIRALAKEIRLATERAITGLGLYWRVEVRSGDTTTSERQKQWKNPPHILITTPESIHVMLATKGHSKLFSSLEMVVIDEWHELVGSKRGVQTELLLAHFRYHNKGLQVWGISATIGNLEEATTILLGPNHYEHSNIIKANIQKKIEVLSLIPEEVERYPWAGHLGLQMAHAIVPIIYAAKTTLIFTNTRAQCEIWYQKLLEIEPDLAGVMAMHHGSISREIRD